MDTLSLTPERRPSVKVTVEGKPYLLVHTRRGPRTRQISQPGWDWVRTRYPSDRYPAPEDIPLTYADYQNLRSRGFIGTSDAHRPVPAGDRPLMGHSGAELIELFRARSFDATILAQLAHELQYRTRPRMRGLRQEVEAALGRRRTPAPGKPTARPPAVTCRSCGAVQRDSARFCPACGSRRDGGTDRRINVDQPRQATLRSMPSRANQGESSGELKGC